MEQNSQQQLNKKELKERERQQKDEEREKREKKQLLKKYSKWLIYLVLLTVVIFGIIFISNQPKSVRPGQAIPIQGREHISESADVPIYNSNPPTSGPHAGPVKGGFYSGEIKDSNAVHNLEHGFVWISYKDVNDETIEKLEKIGRSFSGSVIVSRREANDSKIALVSWGRLEKMDTFNDELTIEFIKKNVNKSPERLAK